MSNKILSGQSCASEAKQAAQEFYAAVFQPEIELLIFFCSSQYDLPVLAAEMSRLFGTTKVIGCTTAGEIGPAGYRQRSLSGVSFPAGDFVAVSDLLPHLRQFEISHGHDYTQNLLRQLHHRAPHADASNSFAFLMIDGMSVREEPVTHALQRALGNLTLFGGSAGDDLEFKQTQVYFEGKFSTDSAVLTLVHTRLPFQIFKTEHFASTDSRFVVTEADADKRIVKEINGLPAAKEYARLVGVDMHNLNPLRFAASPVVVKINGTDYVRSIQKVNADDSLTFFCAIEEGLVLRVAYGVNMADNLEAAFSQVKQAIGEPQLVLGCDCILRNLEMSQSGNRDLIADILLRHHTVGFSSYGEQFGHVHVNQTFTACAIGK